MSKLDEETLEIVRASLFDESILKKLRETPIANFSNAPGGEQVDSFLCYLPHSFIPPFPRSFLNLVAGSLVSRY